VVPTILIIIVFVWGFRTYLKMNVVPKDAIEIKVTGQKWFWSFDYPDGVTTVNELVVPLDKPVKLVMSSRDVIHSFFVPDFRVKMDVLPNRYTVTWFEATKLGNHNIFCAEYCGKGHSDMLGTVNVVSPLEYAKWLEEGATLGEGLTLEELGALLYTAKACHTCHKIDGAASTGPTFKNLYGHAAPMEDGTQQIVDENYLRESMLNPMSKIVAGFQPVMPTYQGILKDREIDALIAYIKSLQTEKDRSDE
jgi:cytochrome c oxidase subunit 2